MARIRDPLDITLPDDAREMVDNAILDAVEEMVEACQDRDEQLLDLRDQNEGIDPLPAAKPWPGACELTDTVSREMHTTMLAALKQSQRYPYFLVEPVDPSDSAAAARVESWLNPKLRYCGWEEAVQNLAYNALESLYAPLYVGWKTTFRGYTHVGARGKAVHTAAPVYQGYEFRTPDPWDIYTYPATASDLSPETPGGADAVIERTYLTEADLLRGIELHGYDKDAVERVLATGTSERLDELSERRGVRAENLFEAYTWLGRMPLDRHQVEKLPDSIGKAALLMDFVWVVVPSARVVLRRAYSPYPVRPYTHVCAFTVPNSLLGHGIVSMLTNIQNEMTATLRLAMDNMTLVGSAPFLVPETHVHRYGDVKFAPGATIPVPVGGAIQQLQISPMGAQLALEFQNYLYQRASQIAAAQGVNSMLGGKVRKATEVEFTAAMLQTKFDLVVANFMRGLERAAEVIIAVGLAYISPDGDTVATPHGPVHIMADAMQRRFRFIPQVSSDNVNIATRLQRDMEIIQLVRSSPIYQAMMAVGDMRLESMLMARLMEHLGARDVAAVIGPDSEIIGLIAQGAQEARGETGTVPEGGGDVGSVEEPPETLA